MFCKECGAEIEDDVKFCPECGTPISKAVKEKKFCSECGTEMGNLDKFCPECGTSISKSAKEEKPKKDANIKKDNVSNNSSKLKKWAIVSSIIIIIVALIVCFSVMQMEKESRETSLSETIAGSYSGSMGTSFTIKGEVNHKNMFGDVEIEDETLEVSIKDKNGKVVDHKTQKSGGEYKYKDLPLGKCTVECDYAGGDYPPAKATKDIKVITKEEQDQKVAKDNKERQEYWDTYTKMYNIVF